MISELSQRVWRIWDGSIGYDKNKQLGESMKLPGHWWTAHPLPFPTPLLLPTLSPLPHSPTPFCLPFPSSSPSYCSLSSLLLFLYFSSSPLLLTALPPGYLPIACSVFWTLWRSLSSTPAPDPHTLLADSSVSNLFVHGIQSRWQLYQEQTQMPASLCLAELQFIGFPWLKLSVAHR